MTTTRLSATGLLFILAFLLCGTLALVLSVRWHYGYLALLGGALLFRGGWELGRRKVALERTEEGGS